MSNDKIKAHHLQRKALLYVRQSSTFQVLHHEESRRLQYAMAERVKALGWQEIEVIDEDLGRSAVSTVGRTGFQYLVAEVCLGKVGAVAAREVSRFARNSRDWHQLVEMCSLVDTVLIDHDTIYDGRQSNDRLLLGLKGTLSEYELDLLRQRSLEARRQKAARGELVLLAPVGYLKTIDGRLEKDPDQRVQNAVSLVFDKFLEIGTVRQTLLWLIEHGLELPAHRLGPLGWETYWKRPAYRTVINILKNPTYAGAYAYGKTEARTQVKDGVLHSSRVRKALERWSVLLPDRYDGYIDWPTFERIRAMIAKNAQAWRTPGTGAPKGGPSLLAGLLRCRRCGRVLMVHYTGRTHDVLRYACRRGRLDTGEACCISFGGAPVEDVVAREVLRVVAPGAVDAALLAASTASRQQQDLLDALALEVKAARYEAERARKQYDAVDPDHRLVADELERRWNHTLIKLAQTESRLEQEQHKQTDDQGEGGWAASLQELPRDLERAWNSPETDWRLKKRIIRTLIEEIVVDVDQQAAEVELVIHWKGGTHTTMRVRRRRTGEHSHQASLDVVEAIRLFARICADDVIAGVLNRNQLRTGYGNRWTKERVAALRSYHRIPRHDKERHLTDTWMTLSEAAACLQVSGKTLRRAVENGLIEGLHPLPLGPWILNRQVLDRPEVQRFIQDVHRHTSPTIGPPEKQLRLDIPTT
jgi:DNA invertase Pin-like site-specific DNA recombinase